MVSAQILFLVCTLTAVDIKCRAVFSCLTSSFLHAPDDVSCDCYKSDASVCTVVLILVTECFSLKAVAAWFMWSSSLLPKDTKSAIYFLFALEKPPPIYIFFTLRCARMLLMFKPLYLS